MRFTRRGLISAGFVSAVLVSVAFAGNEQVIHFAAPSTVTAGQTIEAGVTVSEPMSVTFTSNPPGLVNYTTAVSSTSATVSVPTSPFAAPGGYTVTATPSAGGTSKSATVFLESLTDKPLGGG